MSVHYADDIPVTFSLVAIDGGALVLGALLGQDLVRFGVLVGLVRGQVQPFSLGFLELQLFNLHAEFFFLVEFV